MDKRMNATMNDLIRGKLGRVGEVAPQPSAQSEPYVTANAGAGTGAPPPRPGLSMNDAIRRIRLQYPNVTFTTGD